MRRAALCACFAVLVLPATAQAKPPRWWVRDALCIHRGEGAWNANTGNGYYGGLQMDEAFARSYGGWIVKHHGMPHLWRPGTQLLVAWRGYKARGWYPWPNTARACGLI